VLRKIAQLISLTLITTLPPGLAIAQVSGLSPTLNSVQYQQGTTTNITTVQAESTGSAQTITLPNQTGTALLGITGASASIGGGALGAGVCAGTATTVAGAAVGMSVIATPSTYPGDGNYWVSYVSAANTVETKVCAAVAGTPTASVYNLRVVQ
jgi:hypothetical protein